jgi:hypothetical protein
MDVQFITIALHPFNVIVAEDPQDSVRIGKGGEAGIDQKGG